MAKALLYTANEALNDVALGVAVPLGSIIRRRGCGIDNVGNQITIYGPGYYDVSVSVTFSAAAAGDVGFSLRQDGVDVIGASGVETITTAATEDRTMSFGAIVRSACRGRSVLQIVTDGAVIPTISSIAVKVVEV